MHTGKIKVLHIIARFNIGGTARYLSHLLSSLNDEKFETLLVVGGVQRGEVEDSKLFELKIVRVKQLGRRISLINDLTSYVAIRRVIKEFKPQIIHTHTFKAGVLGRLSYLKIPKVHTFHGHLLTDPEFSTLAKRIIVRVERQLARLSSVLVVTGGQVATDLLEVGVGTQSQYLSIPGEMYPAQLLSREESRRMQGLNDEFTVLWMGRVAPVKNPELLVEVAKKLPEITFLMAGDGILLDKIRVNAPSNLRILGFIDPVNVLRAADIFLSTSLNEGSPYAILEAQCAGLPVIAVNVGALPEMITEGQTGYLVQPSSDVIASCLEKLQLDRELVEKLSAAATENFTRKDSSESISSKHEKLYLQVLGES